jgi:hypothetical protein
MINLSLSILLKTVVVIAPLIIFVKADCHWLRRSLLRQDSLEQKNESKAGPVAADK